MNPAPPITSTLHRSRPRLIGSSVARVAERARRRRRDAAPSSTRPCSADHAADDRRTGSDDAHHERPFDAGLGFDRRAGKDHRVDDRASRGDAGAGTHDAVLDQSPTASTSAVSSIGCAVVEPASTARGGRGWPPGTARDDRRRSSSRRWRRRTARRRRRPSGTRRARSTIARPAASESSTDGSSTYVPALIRLLGSVPGAGFSTNARTRPTPSFVDGDVDDAEARRIVDGDQVDRRLGRRDGDARRRDATTSRSVSTSPLATTNVSSMPAASAAKRIAPAVSSGSGSTA